MLLPEFTTARLRLRPRGHADIPALLLLHADSAVMRFVGGPYTDPAAHRAELIERIERDYGPGLGYWSVFLQDDPERYLGWMVLVPLEGRGPDVEIGWRFARAAWGQGYASEAGRCLLRYGLETRRLKRVLAVLDPQNSRSAQVARRIGMQEAGYRQAYGQRCAVFTAERELL